MLQCQRKPGSQWLLSKDHLPLRLRIHQRPRQRLLRGANALPKSGDPDFSEPITAGPSTAAGWMVTQPTLHRATSRKPAISPRKSTSPVSFTGEKQVQGTKTTALRQAANKELCNFSSIYLAMIYCMLAKSRHFCLAKVMQVEDN